MKSTPAVTPAISGEGVQSPFPPPEPVPEKVEIGHDSDVPQDQEEQANVHDEATCPQQVVHLEQVPSW